MAEQINGALEMDGAQYLVEIKWRGEPVEINAMGRHLVRVYGRSEVRALFHIGLRVHRAGDQGKRAGTEPASDRSR
ncbi:hypothetical protein [Streptomyces sp. NBC_01431]|uniref:hypothetical protein n=1 Tax=Streptomyces sp. NBC_01431 TaxID=2903863 RepID=UPI002E330B3C|nr:hypothetical protein [Streptomyces sp. NBC_01431]